MGIMPMFDKGAILNPVAAFQKQLELAFVTLLKYMGEKLAKYAKDSHNYQDQTGFSPWCSLPHNQTVNKTKKKISKQKNIP